MCNDNIFSDVPNFLSYSDGIILLFFFAIFFVYVFSISNVEGTGKIEIKSISNLKIVTYIGLGLVGLMI